LSGGEEQKLALALIRSPDVLLPAIKEDVDIELQFLILGIERLERAWGLASIQLPQRAHISLRIV